MLRWLWKIIVGRKPAPPCARECQWEEHAKAQYGYRLPTGEELTTSTVYCLRCKTCGDMKNHKVRG